DAGSCYTDDSLDAVVGGKAEAVIVDIAALEGYQRSKPGLGKQLRILTKSELLPSAVVVYRKGSLTQAQLTKVKAGLVNCNKTKIGRQFLDYWNLDGFTDVTNDYLAMLNTCLKNYPCPNEPK